MPFKEALFYKETWIMFFLFLFSIFAGYFMWFTFKTYGSTVGGYSDYSLTVVGMCGSLSNSVSRLVYPHVQNSIGVRLTVTLISVTTAIAALLTPLCIKSIVTFGIVICVMTFNLGGMFSNSPALSAMIFGPVVGGQIYSVVYSAMGFSCLSSYFLQVNLGGIFTEQDIYLISVIPCCLAVVLEY